MAASGFEDHLSRISTMWTAVIRAHSQDSEAAQIAQGRIIERYASASYRYLLRVLGDREAAEEVFQEFALRLVRGDFHRADPSRGRFRDYVKVVILRLASEYRKQLAKNAAVRSDVGQEVKAESQPVLESEREFISACRAELLGRTWQALQRIEEQAGRPYHTVLTYRTLHPQCTSQEIADDLTNRLNPEIPLNAAAIRKTLQRAREKFAELLIDEVSMSLEDDSREMLEQELLDLGLMPYCRSAWQRRYG